MVKVSPPSGDAETRRRGERRNAPFARVSNLAGLEKKFTPRGMRRTFKRSSLRS
jgi:hypothetical protein